MIICTTHLNADFDCIGAMIGIKKMHPKAWIIFPGSKEPAVRDFLKSGYFSLEEKKLKSFDPSEITKIILVDTQNVDRLGPVTDLLRKRKDIPVEVIDHHKDSPSLPSAKKSIIRPVGSTTTIVINMLRDRNIPIEPKEATVMALGIYEDTGFLLFPTTTPEDLSAVGYLLGCGADLRVVSSILKRGLNSEQIILYNDFITAGKRYEMKGEEVVIAAVRTDKYVQDAALVVHQYCDSENVMHFYALLEMEDRIFLIGRSKLPSINAGKIAEAFGGGGHASASSATIKNMTLFEVKEKLLQVIEENVNPAVSAQDIMSKVVFTTQADTSIEKVLEYMNRSRVNAIPVTKGKKVIGAVSRQMVDGAIYHGMGKMSVREIMLDTLEILPEEADLAEVQKVMIEKNLRFVLIGKGADEIEGIISRMALFRNLYEEQVKRGLSGSKGMRASMENILPMMTKRLQKQIISLLKRAGDVAHSMGVSVYLVGGMVRDLFLKEENTDIDLVIEGNGIEYAKKLARVIKGKLKSHMKFQTAVITLSDGFKIDIASARTEYYEHPAALPTVERGMIRQDLYRRDFTINTLAIKLNGKEYGTLVDYFGGRRDIQEGKIRVLHSLSFIEDPTRAYRAVRFAARFGFDIAKETKHLITVARKKGILERLSGRRIMKELELIFDEEHPVKAVQIMDALGLLECISKEIKLSKSAIALLERIDETLSWYRLLYRKEKPVGYLIYLMGIADAADDKGRLNISERLCITGRDKQILTEYKAKLHQLISSIQRTPRTAMSDIYFHCRDLPLEIILFCIAKTIRLEIKKALTNYLLAWRDTVLEIDGEDLKRLGLKPGPAFSAILNQILKAKIDGKVTKRNEELAFALKLIKKGQKA